jgi:tight adherence protein C
MLLILLIGIVLFGVTAVLVGRALVMPRIRMVETIDQIGSYGFESSPGMEAPVVEELARRRQTNVGKGLGSAAAALGGRLEGRVSATSVDTLRARLVSAGLYTTSPAKFLGYQAMATVALPVLWLWITVSSGTSSALALLGAIICALMGWFLPLSILKRRAQRRLEQIDYEMPELIDTLVTTVEAGIAFAASLQIATQRFHGPLAEELRLMLQEQNMGLNVNEALTHLLERCDTPAIRSFVRSIVQGEVLGVSMGQTLRNLATEMRKRRRQAAEERAQKAPIKMLFPLVFLIFPAIFLILLGPAALSINKVFGQ